MKHLLIYLILLLNFSEVNAQGDCPGICTTTAGTYTAVTGAQLELTAATRGCLAAGEANSSYWFEFCFATSGVFQFYIDPSGNRNDFDFAIWNVATCPPSTTPIRCSYAAVPNGGPCATCDYTGLGNGATDLSESATGNGWVAPLNVTAGQCILLNINNFGNGSSVFTIDLTGTTASITCPVLPIELISFEGVNDGNSNILTWVTATETNNSHFNLDRSLDMFNWIRIATIKGAGTVNTPNIYSVNDYETLNGIIYYRLTQVDYDGRDEIFKVIYIDLSKHSKSCKYTYYNTLGNKVDISKVSSGIYIRVCEDGIAEKIYIQN